MTALAEKIYTEVLELPSDEQVRLLDKLPHTIDAPIDPKIEKAWVEEAHRRLEEIRSGEVKTIPSEQVFKGIEARFGK